MVSLTLDRRLVGWLTTLRDFVVFRTVGGKEIEDGLQIDQKITHQEMANLIGSTRETISLTLAAFKRKELILLQGRTVVLTDLDGLAALT